MLAGGTIAVNLVLVAVVYLALSYGAVTGMLAGTFGGLAQDALAGGIVGLGGMTKTLIGFAGRRARRAVQPVDDGAAAGDVRGRDASCTR